MAAYGYQVPPQYAQPPPPQLYGQPRQEYSRNAFHASTPTPSVASFDPYASTKLPPSGTAAAPSYAPWSHHASVNTATAGGFTPYGVPPSFSNEEMTTAPLEPAQIQFAFQPTGAPSTVFAPSNNHIAPGYHHQPIQRSPSAVSDITMFENIVPATPKVKTTDDALALAEKGNFSEAVADPALIAEQERILQEIQDRAKLAQIRAKYIPKSSQSAVVPYDNSRRLHVPPVPTSLVDPESRSQKQSIAHGGVAVLDPKKDKRKATRTMKTAAGAVGGAVVGGLVLGPVGVVLGAGGGAVATNKVAKARDKRKQQDFEQKNFQAGASQSVAAKGSAAFA